MAQEGQSGWQYRLALRLRLLGNEDSRWHSVTILTGRYPNNIIEQDHRAIKRKCVLMLSVKSFRTAAVTFSGIELAHRIHKRKLAIAYQRHGRPLSLKALWDQAVSGAPLANTEAKLPACLNATELTLSDALKQPVRNLRARGPSWRYQPRSSPEYPAWQIALYMDQPPSIT